MIIGSETGSNSKTQRTYARTQNHPINNSSSLTDDRKDQNPASDAMERKKNIYIDQSPRLRHYVAFMSRHALHIICKHIVHACNTYQCSTGQIHSLQPVYMHALLQCESISLSLQLYSVIPENYSAKLHVKAYDLFTCGWTGKPLENMLTVYTLICPFLLILWCLLLALPLPVE